LLSLSVARHQALLERRTTLQDFPITTVTILGLAGIYAYVAWQLGLPVEDLAVVVGLSILTHAVYDLVRELLDRVRMRREGAFRKQLRQLESTGQNVLRERLQEGLDLLCQNLQASGGLIAVRSDDKFVVTATRHSAPLDSHLPENLVSFDELCQPEDDQLSTLAWIAPSFDGQRQIALVGIGKPRSRPQYSTSDLDLLSEVADQIGTIVSLNNLRPRENDRIHQLVAMSQENATELNSMAGEVIDTITANPDPEFIKMVEDALRHLQDYIVLGQSPLAEWAKVGGDSHVERGKQLQQRLMDAIDSLRPAEKRPGEPLPRVWYNYAVLHDAYVEGAQNREIMARLYISEGTFNRTRRNALRGLARLLLEKTNR
jgi:GAF domain-containing protein